MAPRFGQQAGGGKQPGEQGRDDTERGTGAGDGTRPADLDVDRCQRAETRQVGQEAEHGHRDARDQGKLAFAVVILGERQRRAGIRAAGLRGWISGTTGRVGH
jgi:hypothetical protein